LGPIVTDAACQTQLRGISLQLFYRLFSREIGLRRNARQLEPVVLTEVVEVIDDIDVSILNTPILNSISFLSSLGPMVLRDLEVLGDSGD